MTIKRIAILLFLLCCGAFVNVVIAWGCAVAPSFREVTWPPIAHNECECLHDYDTSTATICAVACRPGRIWISQALKPPFTTFLFLSECTIPFRWSRVVPETGRPLLTECIPAQPEARSCDELASGWPLLALYGNWTSGDGTGDQRIIEHYGVLVLPEIVASFAESSTLPLKPIWPGFAFNTLLYAAMMWLLFFAPFTVRRYFRVKRGRCAKCAYPVGVSNVCTECGAPVAPSRHEVEQAVDHRVDEAEA